MAKTQKYGVKFPFMVDNEDGYFLDLNETLADGVKSQVLHVILTPKGQKLRDPEFGTDLIKYIFSPKDDMVFSDIKTEITKQIEKYVPQVIFRDVNVYTKEEDEHTIIVTVEYGIKMGNNMEITTVAVKL